jgi:Berberine and berberine like
MCAGVRLERQELVAERGEMSICRSPASVLDSPTVIRPEVRSTSRQRSPSSSPIRSPASTGVARIARRGSTTFTHWRADFVKEISDQAVEAHVEHASRMPTWKSTMHLYPIDGAAARVGGDATPWAYRDAKWGQVIVGVDPDPANTPALKQSTVDYFGALHPHSMGGAYVMMMDEGQKRVRASFAGNYERLKQIKRKYDPDNLFHINQNIEP